MTERATESRGSCGREKLGRKDFKKENKKKGQQTNAHKDMQLT